MESLGKFSGNWVILMDCLSLFYVKCDRNFIIYMWCSNDSCKKLQEQKKKAIIILENITRARKFWSSLKKCIKGMRNASNCWDLFWQLMVWPRVYVCCAVLFDGSRCGFLQMTVVPCVIAQFMIHTFSVHLGESGL